VTACAVQVFSTLATQLSPIPSVGLSVGLESLLCQNGCLDPDGVGVAEWGWSRDGCIRCGWQSSKGRGSFVGEFGASHCNQWGRRRALPSHIEEDLLLSLSSDSFLCWFQLRFAYYMRGQHVFQLTMHIVEWPQFDQDDGGSGCDGPPQTFTDYWSKVMTTGASLKLPTASVEFFS